MKMFTVINGSIHINCICKISLFLFFLFPILGLCQNTKIDSLQRLLLSYEGANYYSIKSQLGYEYLIAGYYKRALIVSNELVTVGSKNSDSLQIAQGLAIKASVLRRMGNIDSAIYLYESVYPIAKRNRYEEELKDITNSLGLLYTYQAYFDRALQYLFESLEIRESTANKFDISVALLNIGFVYYRLQDYEQALSYYQRSNELKKLAGTNEDGDLLLVNISLCYTYKKQYSMAKQSIEDGLRLCNDNCSNSFLMVAYNGQGFLLFHQQKLPEAERQFLKSYFIAKSENNVRFQLDNLISLTKIYMKRDQMQLAERYLDLGKELIAEDARYHEELLDLYRQFAEVYRKTKNYQRIAYYQDQLINLQDSIFNQKVTTNLMKAEAGFREREHQAKLMAQKQVNDEVIFRQRVASLFAGVVALLVILLAIVLARSNKQKRFLNKLLHEKVKERTCELERSRDALQRAWEERDGLIKKASDDIRSSMATMRGLCFLGLRDIDHPNAPQYLNKIKNTSDRLSEILNVMVHSNSGECQ